MKDERIALDEANFATTQELFDFSTTEGKAIIIGFAVMGAIVLFNSGLALLRWTTAKRRFSDRCNAIILMVIACFMVRIIYLSGSLCLTFNYLIRQWLLSAT